MECNSPSWHGPISMGFEFDYTCRLLQRLYSLDFATFALPQQREHIVVPRLKTMVLLNVQCVCVCVCVCVCECVHTCTCEINSNTNLCTCRIAQSHTSAGQVETLPERTQCATCGLRLALRIGLGLGVSNLHCPQRSVV